MFGSSKSKVLAKSVRDDIYERLHPYQTDELKDSLTHFSMSTLKSTLKSTLVRGTVLFVSR